MTREEHIDQIIESNSFRKAAYDYIPTGSSRILDFGCNAGELLHRLRRDKRCSGLYGIEVKPADGLQYLDDYWIVDLGEEGAELDKFYLEYFNYVVLHDVIEHLYDPWYVMTKLRKYTHSESEVIVAFPNAQYFFLIYALSLGYMPYGMGGGYFNEEHIRFFTLRSAIECLMLAGYNVERCVGAYHPMFQVREGDTERGLRFPPSGFDDDFKPIHIDFPYRVYKKLFYAMKFILLCTPTREPLVDGPTREGTLTDKRVAIEANVTEAYDRLLPSFL